MHKNIDYSASNILIRMCSLVFLPKVQIFIYCTIVLNSIILGIETFQFIDSNLLIYLKVLDQICLLIFTAELLMKMIVLRFSFFKSSWNIFDFVIVGMSILLDGSPLSILRSLRILLILRLVTNLPRLRFIVESIFRSLPSIGWVFVLLLIIFYVFAVLSTSLFGKSFPSWFGNLGESMYTLFQILTLESWSMGIVRPIMEIYPHAYLIFIPFILLSSFVFLNVFIGIVVNSIGEVSCDIAKAAADANEADTKNIHIQTEIEKDKLISTHMDNKDNKVQLQKELDALKIQITKVENLLNK